MNREGRGAAAMVGANVETWREAGPRLSVHCPVCEERDVECISYAECSRSYVLLFVPLFSSRLSIVECGECGARLESDEELDRLSDLSADELVPHLHPWVGFVPKSMAWVSLVLCIVPIVGQVLSLIVYLVNRRSRGLTKSLSVWAVRISFGFWIVLFVGIAVASVLFPEAFR